jgi:hypothetical protein
MAQNLRLPMINGKGTSPIAFAGKAMLALACAVSLAACSHHADPTAPSAADLAGGSAGGSGGSSGPKVPLGAQAAAPETAPAAPNKDAAEGPVNLPPIPAAPTTPVDPGAMVVHALAETLTGNPAPGVGAFKLVVIRAKVTWTPIKGATSYRVYQLAAHDGQADGEKGTMCYKLPMWIPVAIVGGGLGGFMNLNVGQEYIYTIEAIDRAGNVIARGADNCAPLAPLEIPYLKDPGQNALHVGQEPYFTWTPSNGADGYYIETFATLRGLLPAVPMWRAYRSNPDSMTVQYGQQVDVMEGTRPLQWVLPLSVGSRYAWSVCAIRTDTHTMNTCKAIARATAPINYFAP